MESRCVFAGNLESGEAGVKNQAEFKGSSAGKPEVRLSARSAGYGGEAFVYPVIPVVDRDFSDFGWDVEALASREGHALGEPFVISLAELAGDGGMDTLPHPIMNMIIW